MCAGLRKPCRDSNKHPWAWYSKIDGYLLSMGFSLLMYLASDRYFHIGSVSSMWKSSIMPLGNLGNSLYESIIKVNDLLD
jgi:hypothetical protein